MYLPPSTAGEENTNLKIFPFAYDTVVPSKIRSKSLYLLRFSRYWHFFIFHKNPRWPPKVAKIEIFPLSTEHSCKFSTLSTGHSCTTLRVKKFARNRSISYGFRDIDTFPFSAKIQDGRRKWRKLKLFPLHRTLLYHPVGQKFARNRSISLRFSRYWHFSIFRKNPRWPPEVAKIEIFPLSTGHSCTTLRVKNSLEIALSLTVFEILTLFHFPLKSKMATESGENWNYSPLHRTLLYHPVGQKFARNRSISYGFPNIDTFPFSAKIQDGRQKWRKLKFFPLSTGHSCTTLRVKNSLEIALSLTVFEILTLFHFPRKSKIAARSGENWNFPPFHRTLLYHPVKIRSKSLYLLRFSRYWHFSIFR